MIIQENGIIRPSGPALVIRLWQFKTSKNNLDIDFKKISKEQILMRHTRFYEGFTKVREEENAIHADYVVGHSITVHKFDAEKKKLVPSTVFSHGVANLILRYDLGLIEARGTSWVARIGIRKLEEILDVKIPKYEIPQARIHELLDHAALISTVKIVNTNGSPLQSISLFGNVKESPEWRKVKQNQDENKIEFFRAQLIPPSGHVLSCMVNSRGGILIYKRGDGIPSTDVQWLIGNLL
ncbi:MAG: hypothetical protein ACTSYD_03555 [Candidatus Heimdallarchaeaceae archaeon]